MRMAQWESLLRIKRLASAVTLLSLCRDCLGLDEGFLTSDLSAAWETYAYGQQPGCQLATLHR